MLLIKIFTTIILRMLRAEACASRSNSCRLCHRQQCTCFVRQRLTPQRRALNHSKILIRETHSTSIRETHRQNHTRNSQAIWHLYAKLTGKTIRETHRLSGTYTRNSQAKSYAKLTGETFKNPMRRQLIIYDRSAPIRETHRQNHTRNSQAIWHLYAKLTGKIIRETHRLSGTYTRNSQAKSYAKLTGETFKNIRETHRLL